MANALYNAAKKAFLDADIDLLVDDIRAILIDTDDYAVNLATHDFLDDIPVAAREEVSGALTAKDTTAGVFDAADVSFPAAAGDPCEAIVLYKHTGVEATSNLIAYIDTATGLPVTLNGGNVQIQWDAGANRIFAL